MRTADHYGIPTYKGITGDTIRVGEEGFAIHRARSNRVSGWSYKYVSFLSVDRKKDHYPMLRITSKGLQSVLPIAFEKVEEAEEVKEHLEEAITTPQKGEDIGA